MPTSATATALTPSDGIDRIAKAALASVHGTPQEFSEAEAAKSLADQLCGQADDAYLLPPCLLMLLTTAEWCRPGSDGIPALLRAELKTRLGYDIPLIGGSMARLYCSSDEKPDIEHGIAVAMIQSCEMRFTTGYIETVRPHSVQRLEDLDHLCHEMEAKARAVPGLGSSSDKDLIVFFPGYREGRTKNYDHDIFGEVMEGFHKSYSVFGVSPANQIRSTTGFQFADNVTMESGLAVAIMESDTRIGSALEHGFSPVGDRISVDELANDKLSSHWVKTINGQPAAKYFRELQAEKRYMLGFPVLGLPDGPDYNVMFPLGDLSDDDKPVFLNRAVRKGDRPYLMDTNPDQLKTASKKAVSEALRGATMYDSQPALMLAFPCASRYLQYNSWGFNWSEVVEEVLAGPHDIPLLAGLSAGEFGKDEWRRPRSNNLAAWVAVIGSGRNRRGLNRQQLERLRRSAHKVFRAKTSKEVMTAALQGAIEAGAQGGQICIIDRDNGKILGGNFGMPGRAPQSTQNWDLALAKTARRLIRSDDARGLPRNLKPFAVPMEIAQVIHGSAFAREYSPVKGDDVLALSVLTQNAIFVADSSKDEFQNDDDLASKCAIESYLVIPLPGSGEEAIATMQIGFRPKAVMDQELISFWASYGQKVGQALARAWETEDRQGLEDLGDKVKAICATSVSRMWTSENEVRRLLTTIRQVLKAEYVSVRLRLKLDAAGFDLVAPADRMAEIHKAVRPSIKEGEGSCDPTIARNGRFWNSFEEIQALCRETRCDQPTFPNALPAMVAAYQEEGKRYQSRGVIPLWLGARYEGTLTIASYQADFFNERRKRLARSAGTALTTLLENRRSVWENHYRTKQRMRIDVGKARLLECLIRAVDARGEDWTEVLEHLARMFECEFAGLRLEKNGKLDSDLSFHWPMSSRYLEQFDRLPAQAERFLKPPAQVEHYLVRTDFDPEHWLTGVNSALIVGVVGSDGVPKGILMLVNQHAEDNPFGFDDLVEQQTGLDVGSLLASAAAARENRRNTEALKAQMERAMRVGAAGLFGTLIVHQLNTGLGNIQMDLDNIGHQSIPPEARSIIEGMANERQQLQSVVQELAHRPSFGKQKEELRNLVKLALSISQPEKHGPQLRLLVRKEARNVVEVDIWQIVFGIVNVLDNAIEAAGRPGMVEIDSEAEGEMGVIRIRNSGEPPPPSVRERMFRPGYSSKKDHLGLGLALANDVFETAGGGITPNIPKEGGFEMIMKIPLRRDDEQE